MTSSSRKLLVQLICLHGQARKLCCTRSSDSFSFTVCSMQCGWHLYSRITMGLTSLVHFSRTSFLSTAIRSRKQNFSQLNSTVQFPVFASAYNPRFQENVVFKDYRGRELTYRDLAGRSFRVASEIQRIVGGDEPCRVSFLCPHDASFPITLWASWMAGHTAVPLSATHPDNLLEYFLKTSQAKIMVTTPDHADRLQKLAYTCGCELVVFDFDRLAPVGDEDRVKFSRSNVDADTDALILFTSGTTGQPKGVLLTHGNLEDQVCNICVSFDLCENDTLLHVLPLHHTHGVVHALTSPLAVGARCQMHQKFSAPQVWKELLSDEPSRPTVLMGVPTVYVKLIEEYDRTVHSKEQKDHIRAVCQDRMRLFLSGSASLPVPILEKWEIITGHRILERYGMTEVGVLLSNPLKGPRRPGFVGTTFPSVQVRLVEFESKSSITVLAEGDSKSVRVVASSSNKSNDNNSVVGDLLTKGPSVFKGYYNNPEATAKDFTDDGWFITGDTVEYVDGAFRVLGRKSVDIIKSGGYKLSSLEIEAQLLALPEIQEVSVVGLEDATWGQRVAAVVVWRDNKELSLKEFRALAKGRLPTYMVPSIIKTVREIPRNHLGKVNKRELVKVFAP